MLNSCTSIKTKNNPLYGRFNGESVGGIVVVDGVACRVHKVTAGGSVTLKIYFKFVRFPCAMLLGGCGVYTIHDRFVLTGDMVCVFPKTVKRRAYIIELEKDYKGLRKNELLRVYFPNGDKVEGLTPLGVGDECKRRGCLPVRAVAIKFKENRRGYLYGVGAERELLVDDSFVPLEATLNGMV